jgi:Domain of unknown function (DUF4440)
MKKITLILSLMLTTLGVMAQKADVASLKEAELNRFKVMVAQDEAGLQAVLHHDLFYTHSSASTDTKETYINSIVSKKTIYAAIESEELVPRIYGKTGIINGIVTIKNQTKEGNFTFNHLRYTDVWVFEGKRWQMVSWQSTKLPN